VLAKRFFLFLPVTVRSQLPQDEVRKIIVPSRRIGPLRETWKELIAPLVTHMGLQVRFNTQTKQIELKVGPATKDIAAIQKGQDYCRAFVLGFELKDAVALLRMDDLFIDGFDVDDVKVGKVARFALPYRFSTFSVRRCMASTCPAQSDAWWARTDRPSLQLRTRRARAS
jgi:hypothetical protein